MTRRIDEEFARGLPAASPQSLQILQSWRDRPAAANRLKIGPRPVRFLWLPNQFDPRKETPMHLKQLLPFRRPRKDLPTTAARIAACSHEAVWQRTAHRAGSMGLAEARGYIRARSAAVVAVEVERATVADAALSRDDAETLRRLAGEVVVSRIIRELLNGRRRAGAARKAA